MPKKDPGAEYLVMGREWFEPGPGLIEHINGLRASAGASRIDQLV